MVARFEPQGSRQVTEAPRVSVDGEWLAVEASTVGSSLGYRIGDGSWQLYTGPVQIPPGKAVAVKAVRYGWQESDVLTVP